MNIGDLNNKIYGRKDLGEGEYANYMLKMIEEQQMQNPEFKNFIDIDKEIKF